MEGTKPMTTPQLPDPTIKDLTFQVLMNAANPQSALDAAAAYITAEHQKQLAALPAALRARLHLTLDEMAARLLVNRSTVWRWEHGAKPRPHHMRKLVKLAQEETK